MANEQKLKEQVKNLGVENNTLKNKVKELEKDGPLLTKSVDKVAGLELKLEESTGKVSTLSQEVSAGDAAMKDMRSVISSLEKKTGSSSGPFPKLPTGATKLTEMSLNEDETVQLWKIAVKGGADVTLHIVLNKGKATSAVFTTK